jgi:hypothetical protein
MSPGEKILLRRANCVYIFRWMDAFISGDVATQRFYAHRLAEVRTCREAKSVNRRHLISLFQSCSAKSIPTDKGDVNEFQEQVRRRASKFTKSAGKMVTTAVSTRSHTGPFLFFGAIRGHIGRGDAAQSNR